MIILAVDDENNIQSSEEESWKTPIVTLVKQLKSSHSLIMKSGMAADVLKDLKG